MSDDAQNDDGEIEVPGIEILPRAKTLRVGIDIDHGGQGAVRLCLIRIRKPRFQVDSNVDKEAHSWSNDVWARWCGPKALTQHRKVVMESFLVPEGQLPSSYQGKYMRATTKDRALVQRIFDQKRLAGLNGRTMEFKRLKTAVTALIEGTASVYDVEELYRTYGARGQQTAGRVVNKHRKDRTTGKTTRAPLPTMTAEIVGEHQHETEGFNFGIDELDIEPGIEARESEAVHIDKDITMSNTSTTPMTTDSDDSDDIQTVYQFGHSTKT